MKRTIRTTITYIANRLREPTTWAGLVVALQEAGAQISPEYATDIRTTGIALASIIVVLMKEGRAKD